MLGLGVKPVKPPKYALSSWQAAKHWVLVHHFLDQETNVFHQNKSKNKLNALCYTAHGILYLDHMCTVKSSQPNVLELTLKGLQITICSSTW